MEAHYAPADLAANRQYSQSSVTDSGSGEWHDSLVFGLRRLSRMSLDAINLSGCFPKSPMRTPDPKQTLGLPFD